MKNTLFLLLIICITGCSKNTNDLANDLTPVADFTYTAPTVVNTVIAFKNSSANVATYNWDFGDSTTSQEANPIHIYKKAGTYSVVLITYGKPEANVINDAMVKLVKIDPRNY